MIREAPSCVSRARARKRQYVEKQSFDVPDDPVESVELVKRHRVLGEPYEVFDVRCARSRWWVITNITNLYDQDEFRTADYAFSFHLGLMLRLWERDRVTTEDEPRSVSERAWRKYQDAVEALGEANEHRGLPDGRCSPSRGDDRPGCRPGR